MAVVLAILFEPWKWLYTFKRDRVKFFIAVPLYCFLVALAITFLFLFAVGCGAGDARTCSIGKVLGGAGLGILYFLWTALPVVWIWAIMDVALKSKEYYRYSPYYFSELGGVRIGPRRSLPNQPL